jgi:hypothetical protein
MAAETLAVIGATLVTSRPSRIQVMPSGHGDERMEPTPREAIQPRQDIRLDDLGSRCRSGPAMLQMLRRHRLRCEQRVATPTNAPSGRADGTPEPIRLEDQGQQLHSPRPLPQQRFDGKAAGLAGRDGSVHPA